MANYCTHETPDVWTATLCTSLLIHSYQGCQKQIIPSWRSQRVQDSWATHNQLCGCGCQTPAAVHTCGLASVAWWGMSWSPHHKSVLPSAPPPCAKGSSKNLPLCLLGDWSKLSFMGEVFNTAIYKLLTISFCVIVSIQTYCTLSVSLESNSKLHLKDWITLSVINPD